jgi:hypothetical protein
MARSVPYLYLLRKTSNLCCAIGKIYGYGEIHLRIQCRQGEWSKIPSWEKGLLFPCERWIEQIVDETIITTAAITIKPNCLELSLA